MNFDHNKDGFQELPPFLSDQVSPYLSPFHGLQSEDESNSLDRMLPMQIQEGPVADPNELDEEDYSGIKKQNYSNQYSDYDRNDSQSDRHDGIKKQAKMPAIPQNKQQSPIKAIIVFLVENNDVSQAELLQLGRPLYEDSRDSQFIFQVLMNKFIKLYKTKQQMTKYCMRKAFKFIGDLKIKSKKKNVRSRKNQTDDYLSLELPFKKNSQQKTMNTNFLKRTFSNKQFLIGYQKFLSNFQALIEEDNEAKIDFLAQMVQKMIKNKQIQKIENIKRLPWTKSILQKTEELAVKLLEYAEGNQEGLQPPNSHLQQ